ncbi:chorismate-binding protein [Myroides sp. 1354]|uniref:chorismate-binding protein n=1 Tax=unclassified Myroides TaxID=2642485 RepID=UPI0025766C1B|nr:MULTISPECIES: chorismate-binding protein [unclassified Myroides]MDM1044475.1 chorismate-binding protein [Myroides sp. R163-1]MDM1056824.1 chorismate-binding protein [Myroides sp. 1354]MDM1069905.1 chorismate-binding protein [Myroides sp. 1372]
MRLYETWTQHIAADKPYVLYKKPGQTQVIGLFQRDNTLHQVEHFTESGFILAPFHEGIRFYIPLAHADKIEEEIPVEAVDFAAFDLDYEAQPAKANFEHLVGRCVTAIKNGQFSKVVPARKEEVAVEVTEIQSLFTKLLVAYPEAFCYVIYHPQIGLWMGATPETLVELKGKVLHTMALAGTQVNHGKDEVRWGEKEREEQRYVTEFIVEKLQPLSTHIEVSEPFTKRAAKVMHICTNIEAELKEVDVQTIVEALHPTPAVCGMPKDVSRDFLLHEEGYSRKYYAGYLGELNVPIAENSQHSRLFVNLRCMEIEKEHVNLYIGCGVTEDSDPTSEFIETVNKSTTMKKVLF